MVLNRFSMGKETLPFEGEPWLPDLEAGIKGSGGVFVELNDGVT